jgi:hypothetical protein
LFVGIDIACKFSNSEELTEGQKDDRRLRTDGHFFMLAIELDARIILTNEREWAG